MSGVPVEVEISPASARELTDRIRVGVDAVWDMIKRAYTSRAWSVLGYSSWDDYCTREFGTSRIRLPREERQEVVASMREIGMSTRAIASATGTSHQTVANSLNAGVKNLTPDPAPITGTDGKTYNPRPEFNSAHDRNEEIVPGMTADQLDELNVPPAPEPPAPRRRPITEAFDSASYELRRAVEKVERLTSDDRLEKNKEQIATANLSDLIRVRDSINGIITQLERNHAA